MAPREPLETERRLDMKELNKRLTVLENGHSHLCDQIAELTVEQREMPSRIEEAVRQGVKQAASEFVEQLQSKAAEHTGRWLWSTLKAAVTRWLVIGLLVLITYKYLGSGAAGSLLDSVTGVKK